MFGNSFFGKSRFSRLIILISLIILVAIPIAAGAIGPYANDTAGSSNNDYVLMNEGGTPAFQNACVLQYQTRNASATQKDYVTRAMNKIGQAMGVPTQYMGDTSFAPVPFWYRNRLTDQDKIFPYPYFVLSFNETDVPGGGAGAAGPVEAYENPNSDFANQTVYREQQKHFVSRGGVAMFTTLLDARPAPHNTVLHESMHMMNLNDKYNTDTMMGNRVYDPNGDFAQEDLRKLWEAGTNSRNPNTCWISETMNRALRPDVTRPYTPTKPISMPTGHYECGGSTGCTWVPNDPNQSTTTTTKPASTTTTTTTRPASTTTTTKPSTTTTTRPTSTTTTTVPSNLIDGLLITTTYDKLPKKIGDKVTFTFKVMNTGTTSLSQIVLSAQSLNKAGTNSFATIPGLFAGWSQNITAVYTWDGRNFFGPQNKLTATATPLNPDYSARPQIKYPSGL
ncbi:MAG: hypothetical protein U0R17_04870 [Acidimicrobiia bacterium]